MNSDCLQSIWSSHGDAYTCRAEVVLLHCVHNVVQICICLCMAAGICRATSWKGSHNTCSLCAPVLLLLDWWMIVTGQRSQSSQSSGTCRWNIPGVTATTCLISFSVPAAFSAVTHRLQSLQQKRLLRQVEVELTALALGQSRLRSSQLWDVCRSCS